MMEESRNQRGSVEESRSWRGMTRRWSQGPSVVEEESCRRTDLDGSPVEDATAWRTCTSAVGGGTGRKNDLVFGVSGAVTLYSAGSARVWVQPVAS
jgi:hypothetical protein